MARHDERMPDEVQKTLEGYDDWLNELEAQEQAYDREMASRLAAALDRLREEGRDGDLRESGDRASVAGTPPAAKPGESTNRVLCRHRAAERRTRRCSTR